MVDRQNRLLTDKLEEQNRSKVPFFTNVAVRRDSYDSTVETASFECSSYLIEEFSDDSDTSVNTVISK